MAGASPNLTGAARAAAATIESQELLDPGHLVLVAFSGGADSAALCLILRQLGYRVVLGHVNHGMRPDSEVDAEHCRATATRWGLPIHVTRLETPPSTEALARRARYEALQAMAAQTGADRIATGHTLDDQAETVKMRLDRGGFGLGIPYKRGSIVRPLLEIRRRATESVCQRAHYAYLTDPTNADLRYTRNRVRHALKQAGDEEILALARMADASRAEVEAMTQVAFHIWAEAVTIEDDLIFVQRSIAQDQRSAKAVLRMVLFTLEIDASGGLIDDLLKKVLPVTGSRLDLPGGMLAWSERDHLVIGDPTPVGSLPETYVRSNGLTRCPQWRLDVEIFHRAPVEFTKDGLDEFFDEARLNGPLAIRAWQPGDRFQPLGMDAAKKLQDFFVDSHVPKRSRDGIPILVCGDQIAWVVGHRIDDRFKVTDESRPATRIKVTTGGSGG